MLKGNKGLRILSIKLYALPEGYKAHVHKLKPGEVFGDSGAMYDSRMEEERRRMEMFPEFRSWSKPIYPRRKTHSNPTGQTPTNPTARTHPMRTNDPPPRPEKAKTGESCTTKPVIDQA